MLGTRHANDLKAVTYESLARDNNEQIEDDVLAKKNFRPRIGRLKANAALAMHFHIKVRRQVLYWSH